MHDFFADDGHWTRGSYDDGNGGHCLVGALLYLSRKPRPRAREASVQISLQFDPSRTVDSAAQDVQAAVGAINAPCYDRYPVLTKGRAISW